MLASRAMADIVPMAMPAMAPVERPLFEWEGVEEVIGGFVLEDELVGFAAKEEVGLKVADVQEGDGYTTRFWVVCRWLCHRMKFLASGSTNRYAALRKV